MAAGANTTGPVPRIARVGVGLLFIGLELLWRDPKWWDAPVGLIVMPAVVIGAVALWSRRSPNPIRATGPVGHVANVAVLVPLLLLPPTSGGALVFYGTSMLVAAARGMRDCEVTAVSNALLDRDDQVGCPLFAPIDAADASLRRRNADSRR